ncbi:peptide ABC transporter permease [Salipaludibacillus keqinensis]|uniref:Peptide ABC transporter permease n=1 Tax=Salipaludibacillus keqinensis TaxID=2045207 RepID=A0A323T4N2_9BACI|nr:anti-sigma-F factor Fin family protein [Salipaludibacillus keqinensis]PYZ91582.1 peptide ABC transporter permease [Salipaludibacillus keqinensis]
MAVHYYCRHCNSKVGLIDSAVDSRQLGLQQLTEQEKQEMIEYDKEGHVHIRTICEDCEQTLIEYPNYHEQESFLH